MSGHKKFQFYCDQCHWRRICDSDGIKDLYEYPQQNVPGGAPQLDPKTGLLPRDKNGNIIPQPSTKLKRKFRCPGCGRAIVPRLIDDPQKNYEEKVEIEKRAKERKDLEESILMRDRKKKQNEEGRSTGSQSGSEGF
jgi:hypothetical protein